jgi:glutamate 5-kinase
MQVSVLVQADWLFLMTDVDCLYSANPKIDPTATPIYEVRRRLGCGQAGSTMGALHYCLYLSSGPAARAVLQARS